MTHHVYVSANSQDSSDNGRQGHTVPLTAATAAAALGTEVGAGTRVITTAGPGEATTAIARTATYVQPGPRVKTADEVNRELAKAKRDDPPWFLGIVAQLGYPDNQPPAVAS